MGAADRLKRDEDEVVPETPTIEIPGDWTAIILIGDSEFEIGDQSGKIWFRENFPQAATDLDQAYMTWDISYVRNQKIKVVCIQKYSNYNHNKVVDTLRRLSANGLGIDKIQHPIKTPDTPPETTATPRFARLRNLLNRLR